MLALEFVLLGVACLAAFARPVWGFCIILLVTSTLFHLHQYLTVPLPVGYIEPTEALLATMLVAVWLKRSGISPRRDRGRELVSNGNRLLARQALAIIGPYCLWQTFCILLGLINPDGKEFRFVVRSFLSEVLPWVSLYILAKLSTEDSHKLFVAAYYLTLMTACVHVGLQLMDFRPAMKAAYWFIPENSEYDFSWVRQWVDHDAFVRGLPQGLNLILFFTLLKLAEYAFAPRRRTGIRGLAATVVLFTALFIIVTRSLMIVLTAGIIVLIGLALLTLRANVGQAIRIASVLSFFVAAALIYNAIRPGFLGFWSERMEQFSGADSKIFSEENKARGLDNLAAMQAIRDYPLFGVGMARIPGEYSLRDDGPPTDTHPMLEIGLIGGIPAMLLIVLLQVRLFLPRLMDAFSHPLAARELLPFLSILIMSAFALNMAGGGGTLSGPPILFVAIFATEMWNRWAPASVADEHRYVRPRMEEDDAVGAATHFGLNTVL